MINMMATRLRLWSDRIKQHPMVAALVCVGSVIGITFIVVVILGYWLTWHWTGLVSETTKPKQHAKTLWDWLQLFIIPIVLAVGGFLLSQVQKNTERKTTLDNQQEVALQTYIDKISELLLKEHLAGLTEDGNLKPEEYEQVRNIARVRTLTVLPRLDPDRKGSVLQFLADAGLIKKDNPIIKLARTDFSGIVLKTTRFTGPFSTVEVNLSGANFSNAVLPFVFFTNSRLGATNFRGANLRAAHLIKADLSGADLSGADLEGADLSGADLRGTKLEGANLSRANLSGTYSHGGAHLSEDQKSRLARKPEDDYSPTL